MSRPNPIMQLTEGTLQLLLMVMVSLMASSVLPQIWTYIRKPSPYNGKAEIIWEQMQGVVAQLQHQVGELKKELRDVKLEHRQEVERKEYKIRNLEELLEETRLALLRIRHEPNGSGTHANQEIPGVIIRMTRKQLLRRLAEQMDDFMNSDDLRTLCFNMDISYENLSGDTKFGRMISLLEYVDNRDIPSQLLTYLNDQRPEIDWGE